MSLPIHGQAALLVRKYGFHLVEIPAGSKAPRRDNWQKDTISTPEAAEAHWREHPTDNLGVVLGPSHLCSIDVDDVENTRLIFAEFGIDIDQYAQLYTSCRGNPKRFKVFFRVPEGMELDRHVISWPRKDDPSKKAVVFEVRGGTGQDVLPPSTHPDGYPYEWICKPNGTIAEIPPELRVILEQWPIFKKNAAALCPWAPAAIKPPAFVPRADAPKSGVIEAWNAAHDLEATLLAHGYTKQGHRFLSPHSTTMLPGVSILPDGQRAWIHHASDPLCSEESGQPVGAFDLYCYYEHGGDVRKAVKQAAETLGLPKVSRETLGEPPERIGDFIGDSAPIVSDYEPPVRGFEFVRALDLVAEQTPTDWLLQDWFERNTLAMYFGDPGACKTWIALSQAVHIAQGAPSWFGSRVQSGSVFVLCGEGHRGFRRRLEGIRVHHGFDYGSTELYVSKGPANLIERESVNEVLVSVQRLSDAISVAPTLVVVDTLSRNFGAGDENSTPDMGAFINACDRIRTAYGCAILLVHHSGHGDKTRGRGNSALRAALDAEYKFTKDEAGTIEATCTKAKDFEAPDLRRYRLRGITLDWTPGDDGLPVSSAAIEPMLETGPSAYQVAGRPKGRNQVAAFNALASLHRAHRDRLDAAGREDALSRVSIEEWKEECANVGMDRSRFRESRVGLEQEGVISSDGIYVSITIDH